MICRYDTNSLFVAEGRVLQSKDTEVAENNCTDVHFIVILIDGFYKLGSTVCDFLLCCFWTPLTRIQVFERQGTKPRYRCQSMCHAPGALAKLYLLWHEWGKNSRENTTCSSQPLAYDRKAQRKDKNWNITLNAVEKREMALRCNALAAKMLRFKKKNRLLHNASDILFIYFPAWAISLFFNFHPVLLLMMN